MQTYIKIVKNQIYAPIFLVIIESKEQFFKIQFSKLYFDKLYLDYYKFYRQSKNYFDISKVINNNCN